MTKSILLKTLATLSMGLSPLAAQQLELSGLIGGQLNGGVNYSTTKYARADFTNALTYGVAVGAGLSNVVSLEFQWNHSSPSLMGVPTNGGAAEKVFSTGLNQYFGNILFHVANEESRLRPFILVGVGAMHFSPAAPDTNSLTRTVMAFGGGAKYFLTKSAGLRFQARWLPVGMYSTESGTWCGPVTGCWSSGSEHFLHSLELNAGVTFRF